jgi:hypothetical protein
VVPRTTGSRGQQGGVIVVTFLRDVNCENFFTR